MRQKENRWRWLTSDKYFGFEYAPWYLSIGAAGSAVQAVSFYLNT